MDMEKGKRVQEVGKPTPSKPKGQGLVEFALLLPVLLLVVLGIIEAALVIAAYLGVQHAAREAARFAVTYQPPQGACLDLDGDGVLEDGISHDPDDRAPYPVCPVDNWGNPAETEEHYHARRVELIKREARRAAAALRIDDSCLGDTPERFEQCKDRPAFFGVLVWGYPSFLTDCNADPSQCLDHPGLEGLPVRVMVVHNVEIVDPFYRAIIPYFPLQADTQMINEGIQVGFGDMPPPAFDSGPGYFGETPLPTNTSESSLTPTPTEPWHTYSINLDVEHATNTLPDERGHEFVATVTDELDRPVAGARVSFSTDLGGFDYSGIEPLYVEELTNLEGQAPVTLYGNEPMTATLRAWLDYDGDDVWDAGEPYDTATKAWHVSGPHITVSDHKVIPLDYVYADVMDHNPTNNPYRLLWCVISGTVTSQVLQEPLNVGPDGNLTDLGFEIPVNSEGEYRLETHVGGGGCGDPDLIAYSATILVTSMPPDLHIANISWPEQYGDELPDGVPISLTMEIENLSPTRVENTYFDVDLYLDPLAPPPFQGQVGTVKQWLLDIDAYGTQEVNAVVELSSGTHYLWGQVDTSNYIEETDEDNNVSGPYTLTVACTVNSTPYGDDFNDGAVDGKWTATQIGSPNVYGSLSESGGLLNIDARGGRIWGSGGDENFYYVYQSISGDFDARLRVVSVPTIRQYSKMGLMVRNSTASNSRHVMLMRTDYNRSLQFAYRPQDGWNTDRAGNDLRTSAPVWVRIVRSGDTFDYYYSTASDPTEGDWAYYTSVTVDMDDTVMVGMAHATYNTSRNGTSQADEFVICLPQQEVGGDIRPPGLRECQQLLHARSFEGNPDTVFQHWNAGGPNAFQHQSRYFTEGSMSVRLHASVGSYPDCPVLSPYLYQTVEIPAEVYTMTTMVVGGDRLVAGPVGSGLCSYPGSVDADDSLYLRMRDGGGGALGTPTEVVSGGVVSETWGTFAVDVTDVVDPYNNPGESVQVYFYGDHDGDYYGTWFYVDNLYCEVCTEWPIPPEEPGTASIGGEVRVLVQGIPRALQGVHVWAYSPGGNFYHTVTIQGGAYHFYNIPPGTYTVYSEVWVGNELRFATTTVTVAAGERNYNVNLFLL